MIKGIPASKGIGIGKVIIYGRDEDSGRFTGQKITSAETGQEIERVKKAVNAAGEELETAINKASELLGKKEAQVFQAYKMVLKDPILNDMILSNIQQRLLSAEAAVLDAISQIKAMFLAIKNDYMQQRAEDVEHVGNYILDFLLGRQRIDLSHLKEDSILIAQDLTPADTVALDRNHIKGFAIEKGGVTSHIAIVARTLEIPAVVGCGEELLKITQGTQVVLDGAAGVIIQDPTQEELDVYASKCRMYQEEETRIQNLRDEPAQTPDGRRVELAGNIALPEEAALVLEKGGDGIGLFRTEFLYMNSNKLPSEEEQYQAYRKTVEIMSGKPCIIRTMDIGGDKQLPHLGIPTEENPFLGYRAIRICLKEVELFKTQLRALLRASAHGNLSIMFPMISSLEEIRAVKRILDEVRAELKEKGQAFNPDIKIGIMIEIPSAAMMADLLAKEVDFFSIGSNDLCQYTLAVDRMNESIGYLYNPLNLGVLRLIQRVIDAGHQAGIKVGMCGEMASNIENAVLLLGLGLDEFSMVPSAIPYIKEMIRRVPHERAREIAQAVMQMEDSETILKYIKEKIYAD